MCVYRSHFISPIDLKADEKHQLVEEEKRGQEANELRRQILRWLSPDDYAEIHEEHYGKRFRNTGQWLLDDPRFISWRDGMESSLLWCHGTRKCQYYFCIYLELY